jgi:alkanesulfonate monooxygenase SsuD/methylene tetrahydromethanopterin reductase-like flavin-dependent oxidoreductase (luciferase family)
VAFIILRFDLRSAPGFGAPHADLYQGALDMCEWADGLEGQMVQVLLHEHHVSPDGYSPAPIVFAAAVAGRTENVGINIAAIILPLHNPLRLAEDLAVLDIVSRGRASWVFAVGYRREEYAALGVDIDRRAELMEFGVETLKQAWTGEPFEFNGVPAQVLPRPYTQPRPPITLGGNSKPAARRAARIADAFMPGTAGMMAVYRNELAQLGQDPGPEMPDLEDTTPVVVSVSDDPDAAWAKVGPYCMHEMNTYAEWFRDGAGGAGPYWIVDDIDELRESGAYLAVTPAELTEMLRTNGYMMLHPLCGGIPPELAWETLRAIETRVLPGV